MLRLTVEVMVADCFKICSSSTLSPLCIIKVVASESSIQNHVFKITVKNMANNITS